jgi:hypothetical protein
MLRPINLAQLTESGNENRYSRNDSRQIRQKRTGALTEGENLKGEWAGDGR